MKIMPIYDLRNKAEAALLMKRLDDDTVDSIEGLPDSMILLVPEKACPTISLLLIDFVLLLFLFSFFISLIFSFFFNYFMSIIFGIANLFISFYNSIFPNVF